MIESGNGGSGVGEPRRGHFMFCGYRSMFQAGCEADLS